MSPAKRRPRYVSEDTLQPLDAAQRSAALATAIAEFNGGRYWEAHEALEQVWRAVREPTERRVWQGLIQAAAALLHRERGNRHGVTVVGEAALAKLEGPQHPRVEMETEEFRAALRRALEENGPAPTLRLRGM